MTFVSYAQNFEDVILWRAFKNRTDGFYIDVGAWDPDIDSVTRAFSDRGWRGVNIEPLPAFHQKLQLRRPRDVNLMAVAGACDASVPFYEVEGTGLSTLDAELANAHASAGHSRLTYDVAMITLTDVCRAHAPATIEFLKIDCEGAEAAVLRGLDLAVYRPLVILVEATVPGTQEPNHAAWESILLQADYRFVWFDGLNRFYVASEHHAALAPKLALPPNVFDVFVRAADRSQVLTPPAGLFDATIDDPPPSFSIEERIALAQRCRDCDDILKVPDAGRVLTLPDGTRVQVMHNGLRVAADAYCGAWMTQLIAGCQGHHEPQEELVFHKTVECLPDDATSIEIGGGWSYYTAWFLHGRPQRRAVVLEPDANNLANGRRTMQLNGLHADFVAGFAGSSFAPEVEGATETAGTVILPRFSVPKLMADHGIDHLDLLHCDAQGVELSVLEGCAALFEARKIDFVFVSTHVHRITGDPLTHRRCLDVLKRCGAAIDADHDPYESFCGDGLIVARFCAAPKGWTVPSISYARHREVLFRDLSFDLAEAQASAAFTRSLVANLVTDVFDALLLRDASQSDLDHFVSVLKQTGGDVAGFLRFILTSPEFRGKASLFAATYFEPVENDKQRLTS